MPRVLSLSTLYPNSAQPRFGTFVARSLEALQRETEWDATVLNPIGVPPLALGAYRARAEAAVAGVEHGVAVHRPTFRLLPGVGGRFNPAAIAREAIPLARRLHREARFDLVDAQFFYPDGPAAMRVAKALGLPLSIKARGADIHYWGAKPYARAAMLEAGKAATGLLAVCEALAGDMQAMGLPRDKIAVHYTGLDRDRFRPLDHTRLRPRLAEELDLPLAFAEPLLVSVGALIARKGQELMIRALPGLPGARLLLVGKGPDEAMLRALAMELGVAERVHFLGLLDHDMLPLVLSACDAMVLPSASEGLANAWVEALACGTPLVITDVGGARELVTDSLAGVLVARETQAVREGIERVLAEPRDRQAVAATVERFGWNANARALAAHYDRLLEAAG
ncbi:MAG: glycosyltransferase [Alphaproteobacteria bacterium]|nr:glycosyltransferase [Alphaproteobacteria bacterium]